MTLSAEVGELASRIAQEFNTVRSEIPAGGGSGAFYPSVSAIVFSHAFPAGFLPAQDTSKYIWVCDGTNDQDEINAAITAINSLGGGKVQLIGSEFNIAGPILMKTAVWVAGGGLGTQVNATTSFGAGMFDSFDGTTHAVKVSDFTLDGQGYGVHGVYWNLNSGQVFTSSPSTNPDSANSIDNLNISDVGSATFGGYGLALRGSNLRAGKYSNVRVLGGSGCGVFIDSPDSHYTNIEVGSSGKNGPAYSVTATAPIGAGWYVGGENNMIENCKSWYSRGDGFYIHGTRNSFSNCQAQDNYSYGFNAYYGKCSYASCQADSNGQGTGSATYGGGTAGFNLSSGSNVLAACLSFDRGGQAWAQQYGFKVSSGFNYSRIVGCATYGNAVSSQTGTVAATTTVDIQADSAGK